MRAVSGQRIDGGVEGLELVLRIDEALVRPEVSGGDVVGLVLQRGHDAEVVPCAFNGPVEIPVRGRRCSHKRAVRENDARGDDLVGG